MSRQRFSNRVPARLRQQIADRHLASKPFPVPSAELPCAHVQVPTGRCRAVAAAWPLCEPAAASAAAGASRSSVGATSVPGAGWQTANSILRGACLAQENLICTILSYRTAIFQLPMCIILRHCVDWRAPSSDTDKHERRVIAGANCGKPQPIFLNSLKPSFSFRTRSPI